MSPRATRRAAALLLASTLAAGPGRAADLPSAATATEGALAVYGRERLAFRYEAWAAPSVRIYRGPRDLDIGMLGAGLRETFPDGSPGAEEARSARRHLVAGMSLYTVGLAGIIGGPVWMVRTSGPEDGAFTPAPAVTFLGGIAVVLSGLGLMELASGKLAEAVEAHNRALLERLQAQEAGKGGR